MSCQISNSPLKSRKNYVTKPERFYEHLLRFQAPNLHILIYILSKVLLRSNLFSFFPLSIKTHYSFPPKECLRNKFQIFKSEITFESIKTNDPNSGLKRKGEKKR
jgi:hypothetical protein